MNAPSPADRTLGQEQRALKAAIRALKLAQPVLHELATYGETYPDRSALSQVERAIMTARCALYKMPEPRA